MTQAGQRSSSLRGGIVWSLVSFVGTKSLTFIATLVLARLVVPSEFGVLAAVLAFIGLLEVISDLGMKASVIYDSERGVTSRVQTAFTLNLVFTLLLVAAAVLLAPVVAGFFGAATQTVLFRIAALDLLLIGLGNIHDALLLRDMELRRRTIAQLAANVVRAACTISLAVAGLGATALVVGFIAGTAAWTLSVWILKRFRPTLTIDRQAVRSISSYGGWASALEIIAGVGQRTDVAVIGSALGTRALGIYTIGQRLPELVVGNVTWSLSVVAFPALAKRRDEGHESLTSTTLSLIRYSALFGLTVGAGLAVLASPLVVVLFSARWAEAGAVMAPLALMYGLVCIVFPLGDTFKALGRQRVMVAVNTILIPVSVVAMVIAAPGGIVAVAWSRVLVTVAHGFVWFVLISRVLRLSPLAIVAALRPACAAAAGVALGGGAVRLALPDSAVGPLVIAAAAAAVTGAVALRLLGRQQYEELRGVAIARWVGARRRTRSASGTPPAGEPG